MSSCNFVSYSRSMTNIWWVNQNSSNKVNGVPAYEVVWSPYDTKEPHNPSEQWHWRTMWEAAVGDVVIHYSDQKIVALSTVLISATPALRPYDSTPGSDWVEEGKQIVVSLTRLEAPIWKDEIPLDIRREASKNHGPFTEKGEDVKQGYFFPVPQVLWDYLSGVIGAETQTNDVGGSSASSPVLGSTDIQRIVAARREQPWLRRELLGGASEKPCGICGRMTPEAYLRAAHIKKRAAASERERKDPRIAMLACVFGCDEAFERGDVRVNSSGMVFLADPDDAFLKDRFGFMVGTMAPAFDGATKGYFAHRLKSFGS